MVHAAHRIAVPLAAAMGMGALVCCQQILSLDEGKLTASSGDGGRGRGGGGGTSSTLSSSSRASGASSTGGGPATTSTTSGSATGATTSSGVSASSGSASTGSSSGGTGGSDCVGSVTVTATDLIDDMEEGSGSIIKQGGRAGSWFTFNDGTAGGVEAPDAGGPCLPVAITGGRCGSAHAMHVDGSGYTNYGIGLGFDLNHPSGTRMPYDVTGHTGLAFWARGPQLVQVQVLEQATTPKDQGGTCDTTTSTCADHYFVSVNLSATWEQVVVPFASLKQQGWGTAVAWDPTTVLAVQFAVNPAPTFDFWIDDIGFY
jgi:hypothetical protein